ncbi:hypothetical protein EZV73_26215 [Acidaminobacter sp. JC074]|uniref:hypothetical protein n=1 Tax=Acidaminobacter sp. JC074 TaxID=2530199 RepID=UPI001F0E9A36|nr:hypothetical protein [Acidaminobacter sp. JC074]MCH4891100.1 hypothetical protein [Acidaminobacter sp. JC074]
MKRYTKMIGITGSHYTIEFEKIKHHSNKIREVREDTVAKAFVQGKAEVLVIFEETGKQLLLDNFSDRDQIKKYLGKKFL